MKIKLIAALFIFHSGAALLLSQSAAPKPNPLHRQYREGEKLVYRMNGVNEAWHYSIQADGVVKKDPSGAFFEEYTWSKMESAGQPLTLSPQTADFRQRISLDPDQNPSVPDFTKVDPKLIGPIADFMTFYTDLWLAIKVGQIKQAGDHFYVPNGVPNSWADGSHVVLGESAIDFDLTLKSVNPIDGSAVLLARHVPPQKPQIKLPAAWMQTPVADTANNWVGVSKNQDGSYTAAVGKETFDVEIKLSLADGKILSASMDNPVQTIERKCSDAALTQCDAAKPHTILRKIEIALQP